MGLNIPSNRTPGAWPIWVPPVDDHGSPRRVTKADLLGRPAISYQRYSSTGQGKKKASTLDRQEQVLQEVLAEFGLILDQSIVDRAMSASKGHHRTKGLLGVLLTALDAGAVEPGAVMVVETYDRLFREDWLQVGDLLKRLVKAGIILITGRDKKIWCPIAISEDGRDLMTEIDAAKRYTQRLAELAKGGHQRRRDEARKAASEGTMLDSDISGRAPAWIDKMKGVPFLNPDKTLIVVRIFTMAADGTPVRRIAFLLNEEKVPHLSGKGEWTAPGVAALLRDRHVLGYYQPMKWLENGKRKKLDQEVKAYPAAIDLELWYRVRDALKARTLLTGARGKAVPNLFTRKVFCPTCDAALRIQVSAGRPGKNKRQRALVCTRYVESKTCTDGTYYNLWHFEAPILHALMNLVQLAPPPSNEDTKRLLAELDAVIVRRQKAMAFKEDLTVRWGREESGSDMATTIMNMIVDKAGEIDRLAKQAASMRQRIDHAKTYSSRAGEAWKLLKTTTGPAVAGDVPARERLRSLLAQHDFRITGTGDGGMKVTVGRRSVEIEPADRAAQMVETAEDEAHRLETEESRMDIEGSHRSPGVVLPFTRKS